MASQKLWQNDGLQVVARSLAIYILCLGSFFFYDRAVGYSEAYQLGFTPYGIISLWGVWILFHNRVLVRRLLFRKKWILYSLALLAGIVVTSYLQNQVLRAIGKNPPLREALSTVSYYTLIGALVFMAFLYMKEKNDFYKIATLKKEVELQQLKNQLNPHFLFNSLNNIYSYNLENNKYGNDLILKLSQLMRFIVESTREDLITVKEETDFISNYIAFERERLGHRCNIVFDEHITVPKKMIPPLILFPFVENAFKHGSNSIEGGNIDIRLESSDKTLFLKVKNEIVRDNDSSTKVGLSNIQRRLELLFPGKHQLDIRQSETEYVVNLSVDFSDLS